MSGPIESGELRSPTQTLGLRECLVHKIITPVILGTSPRL